MDASSQLRVIEYPLDDGGLLYASDAVEAGQVRARLRHERYAAGDEVHGFEDHVRGAVAMMEPLEPRTVARRVCGSGLAQLQLDHPDAEASVPLRQATIRPAARR